MTCEALLSHLFIFNLPLRKVMSSKTRNPQSVEALTPAFKESWTRPRTKRQYGRRKEFLAPDVQFASTMWPDHQRAERRVSSLLIAGSTTAICPYSCWAELEIQQAPVCLKRALRAHTHTHTNIHTSSPPPFIKFIYLLFTKIIQKRETGIFTKLHGWYST